MFTHQELERLERELGEMVDRCALLERQNDRHQRELESAKDLQVQVTATHNESNNT